MTLPRGSYECNIHRHGRNSNGPICTARHHPGHPPTFHPGAAPSGSSRSGGTISPGLLLSYRREAAARYSFLLAIPAVLASGLLQLTKIGNGPRPLGDHSGHPRRRRHRRRSLTTANAHAGHPRPSPHAAAIPCDRSGLPKGPGPGDHVPWVVAKGSSPAIPVVDMLEPSGSRWPGPPHGGWARPSIPCR